MKNTRVLLGLVLLLTVGVLWADNAEDRDKRVEIPAADQAVRTIEKLGGRFVRDDKKPGKSVVSVDLSFTQVMDADLKNLATLPQLHTLNLEGTRVTDVGLKNLAALKQLKELGLVDTSVTEAGIQELQNANHGLIVELRPVVRRADEVNGRK